MAKKQQIILTHGTSMPGVDVVKDLKLGEVLVQHAAEAKDAALHTVIEEGNTEGKIVSFPSKEWVTAEVKAVNAETIDKTVAAIDGRVQAIESDYLKSTDKTELEGKITKEATDRQTADEALEAELSGQIEDLDNTLTTKINGIDARVETIEDDYLKSGDKTELEGKITKEATDRQTADEALDAKFGEGISSTNTVAQVIAKEVKDREDGDAALQTAIDAKVAQSEYDTKVGEIEGDINTLQSVLSGYETEGSVKAAIDSKVAQSAYDTKVGEINGKLNGLQNQIDTLGDTYYTEEEIDEKVNTINDNITKAKTTLTEAAPEAGVKVTKTVAEDGHDNYEVTAVGLATTTQMNGVIQRLDTIEGGVEVTGSMKNIAAAEVAKVVDNAPEKFDTLKEIAEWIGSDTTGAAGMATDISNLKATLDGFNTTDTVKKTTDAIDGRVEAIEDDYLKSDDKTALEGKITEEATARKDADDAINAKFGEGITSTNTVAQVIAKEVEDRKTAVQGIQNQIDALDNTYAKDTELASVKTELEGEIAEAKTTLTEAPDVTAGVKVTKTVAEDGHDNYEVTAVGLAAQSTVTAIDGRLATAEGDIDKLEAADIAMEAAYKAADGEVRAAFAEADTALKTELNTEIAKKADQTTVNGIDTRLAAVEGAYVKSVVVKDKDGNVVGNYTPVGNVLDLSKMIIDGGEY